MTYFIVISFWPYLALFFLSDEWRHPEIDTSPAKGPYNGVAA